MCLTTLASNYLRASTHQQMKSILYTQLIFAVKNDADIAPLFPKGEPDRAWKMFYAKYHGSTGILFFSKAGFNSKKTQAFIYAGRQCGGLCGLGKYILLEKKGSAWAIKSEMELWVS
jgi:hypothetical protein